MGPLDGFWHLLNFLAPAFGVSGLAAAAAKKIWPREFAPCSWGGLTRDGTAVGALVLASGMAVTGRDGRVSTYGLLVLAVALILWWKGFGRRRK